MSEQTNGIGEGILKGLKRILFTTEDNSTTTPSPAPTPAVAAPAHSVNIAKPMSTSTSGSPLDTREMKLRVYQLLESMNQGGIDFFEVWNASVEMGGANSTNIKAAFTSLRFADKSLNKAKLLQTADFYIGKIKDVLDTESAKRKQEMETLLQQKTQSRSSLDGQIETTERQIAELQKQLANLKTERDGIDSRFAPQIADIEVKITQGRQAVTSVIDEMTVARQIIDKDID